MKFKFSILVALFLLIPLSSHAARLYFDAPTNEFQKGGEYPLTLMLDPEGESVNALELTLTFPPELLTNRGNTIGSSIVSYWVSKPTRTGNTIKLSGIIPGGFSGVIDPGEVKLLAGPVATFGFLARASGQGTVALLDIKLIKNDGKGTLLSVRPSTFTFSIREGPAASSSLEQPLDTVPPEPFMPQVIQSKYIEGGAYVLIFETKDEDSGVERYEVQEGERAFSPAESPYVLKDQSQTGIIKVKAIDYAGNERIVSVMPVKKRSAYPLLLIAALVLITIATWIFKKRR